MSAVKSTKTYLLSGSSCEGTLIPQKPLIQGPFYNLENTAGAVLELLHTVNHKVLL